MRTPRVIFGVVSVLAAAGLITALAQVPREPEYQGRSLSAWLEDLTRFQKPDAREKAIAALQQMQPSPAPFLVERLKVKDPTGRQKHVEAIQGLLALGPAAKGVAQELAGFVTDPDVGDDVIAVLARMGPEGAPILISAYTNPPPLASNATRRELFQQKMLRERLRMALGSAGTNAVPILLKDLKDPDSMVRNEAVLSLGMIEPHDRAVRDALLVTIKDSDETTRRDSAYALAGLGRRSVALFGESRQDDFDPLRNADTLPPADPEVVSALTAMAEKDPESNSREAATQCLLRIDPKGTLEAFSNNLSSSDIELRRNCAWNFMYFKKGGRTVVPALVKCLADPDSNVQQNAAVALREIGENPELVVPALLKMLDDSDPRTREIWGIALGEYGDAAKKAVPTIIEMIKSTTNELISQGLFNALYRIDSNAAIRLQQEAIAAQTNDAASKSAGFDHSGQYDLRTVEGMDAFSGSDAAQKLLSKNGFVVADPSFKQIFEAYIKPPLVAGPRNQGPREGSLPSFITTDSAWHTYHVLLEEGVKNMEENQARRLLDFSRQLWSAASQKPDPNLVLFASVGFGLQDEQHRASLAPDEKRIVDGLRAGKSDVPVPIGFSLSPLSFRAQSFYAQSPVLSDYFAARQWYASVVFRLGSERETKSAVALATLVNDNPRLLALWKQLSDPIDAFLGRAEEGTIREYAAAANAVVGTKFEVGAITDAQIAKIQKMLAAKLSLPKINDQLLSPGQYAQFGQETRGFRLLPPRRLPCAVCFQNTIDPGIPGRMYPSGLDFLVASPVLRSQAAVRAERNQFGKDICDLVLKADSGPMPESLHGEAMRLLARLQDPLPEGVPAALRTEAWSDLQLWTQLGAWAEQRHTWALHTKLSVEYMGIVSPPQGMVAPYPEFFAGLAKLTRRTAEALQQAGAKHEFNAKIVAGELLRSVEQYRKFFKNHDSSELEKLSGDLEQFGVFRGRYFEQHRSELKEDGDPQERLNQMLAKMEEFARRCSTSEANEADLSLLRECFGFSQDTTGLINEFAPVCDRLAELARKSLNRKVLTDEDNQWIKNYGVLLAKFHFYGGNSYLDPHDDFPIVTRVFSNPSTDSMLYAGLARPQALYIIVPTGKSLQLYRGAVMTYREFVRPADPLLDDESWRGLISRKQTPQPPAFTRSFCAEASRSAGGQGE
jgi:HEAT repeat protein